MVNDKKVEYLGTYYTKDQLTTLLNNSHEKLDISIKNKSDSLYIEVQKRDIEHLKQAIRNFDNNAKIVITNANQTAMDYVLNEGYDDDGNYYDSVDSYKDRNKNQKQDNTPWQKGDDYRI